PWLGAVTPERLQKGGVGAVFFALWTPPFERSQQATAFLESAYRRFLDLVAASAGLIVPVDNAAALRRVQAQGKIAALLGIEGADGVTSADELVEWRRRGVRYLGLTWNQPNAYADAAASPPFHGGLSPRGAELVAKAERLGIIIDVSHAAPG